MTDLRRKCLHCKKRMESNERFFNTQVCIDCNKVAIDKVINESKNNNECWKNAVGFEDAYMVSNTGKIYSKKRYKYVGVLNVKTGYMSVRLSHYNKQLSSYVHRIVAEAFVCNPENKKTVNHKNGIKHDNRVENLEWCTNQENIIHCYKVLGYKGNNSFGCFNGCASKKIAQIDPITDQIICEYPSAAEASRVILKDKNTKSANIRNCVTRPHRIKTAYGFKWKFI